jgi:hypothetical protein
MLPGLILFGLIYAGITWFLIVDIIFYSFKEMSTTVSILSMFLGLFIGLLSGNWITKEQLKILQQKSEPEARDYRWVLFVELVGFALFLVCFVLSFQYQIVLLIDGLFVFGFSAIFALCLKRLTVVSSWEKQNGKMVMIAWNRLYLDSE